MGDLNYKKILVILSLFLNLILSVDSVNYNSKENDSKIKINQHNLNQHQPLKNNHNSKLIDHNSARHLDQDVNEFDNDSSENDGTSPQHDIFERKSKPLRNIFMGIYKNYKSTYLGNKTLTEYRKSMHDGWTTETSELNKKFGMNYLTTTASSSNDNETVMEDDNDSTTASDYKTEENQSKRTKLKRKKKKKKKNKESSSVVKKDEALLYSFDGEYRYNIGPGVNISLDMKKDVVSVNLDEDCLKEILLGRWVDENEGRGKKYEMISKILPLFILPFLIQSAIIPFLVTKLKLLLIKSILVGKLAIFLLVISAIKNNQKVATYEPAPAYWAAEPSRRSEIYNGYRVEGRPTTWVQ